MSHQSELPPYNPFNEIEERHLLGEILKTSTVPLETLMHVIYQYQIEPLWYHIALPHGRSVVQCQHAFHGLIQRHPVPPAPVDPKTLKKPKRPLSIGEMATTATAERTLQPRPTGFAPVNGQDLIVPQGDSGDGRPRKKRGRPSKIEHEQRVQEALARGEVYPPPKKNKTLRPSEGGPSAAEPTPSSVTFTPNRTGDPSIPPASPGSSKRKKPSRPDDPMGGMEIPPESGPGPSSLAVQDPSDPVLRTQPSDIDVQVRALAEMQQRATGEPIDTPMQEAESEPAEPETVESSVPVQETVSSPDQPENPLSEQK